MTARYAPVGRVRKVWGLPVAWLAERVEPPPRVVIVVVQQDGTCKLPAVVAGEVMAAPRGAIEGGK